MIMRQWIKVSLWSLFFVPVFLAILGAFKFYSSPIETEENRLIRELQKSYATRMYEQANLQCTMIGTGGTKGLDELSFHFHSPLKIEQQKLYEARTIALSCSETLLNMINSNQSLRPYLVKHPFDHKNIRIIVFFITDKNNSFENRPLWAVSVNKRGLAYQVDGDKEYELVDVKTETYREAIRLAKLEDVSL
jgi:hypothetical protein